MKRILSLIAIAVICVLPSSGQENEDKLKDLENLETGTVLATIPDSVAAADETQAEEAMVNDTADVEEYEEEEETYDDVSSIRIGRNIEVEESDDNVIIRVGEKEIIINEDGEDTTVNFNNFRKEKRSRHFQGHLGGMELGFNSFLEDYWNTSLLPENSFMDLHSAKSTCFNIYSPNVSLGITRRFGLVTTIGINFGNYRFDGNNSVTTDAGGVIVPLIPSDGIVFDKSKLSTVYAVLPVIIEAQIPVSHSSSINIGAGVIGAVKLGSHTKVVSNDGGKQKDKVRDDFNLNLLRYGLTARLGYEMFQVYGTAYLSPLFEDGKGPEIYPFEVGIALTIND